MCIVNVQLMLEISCTVLMWRDKIVSCLQAGMQLELEKT